ncbi:unnamed protein product [Phaeothamnion confervicola]
MHTLWVRLNAVVFFGFTVLLVLAGLTAFSTYLHEGEPIVKKLALRDLRSLRVLQGTDRAMLTFDLDADLRAAFNWNIKQLFVFVTAEYETPTNVLNQVILWDKVVESEQDAVIRQEDKLVKYALIDQKAELRNTSVQLHLNWDHMPLTGRLYMHKTPMEVFQLPGAYKR